MNYWTIITTVFPENFCRAKFSRVMNYFVVSVEGWATDSGREDKPVLLVSPVLFLIWRRHVIVNYKHSLLCRGARTCPKKLVSLTTTLQNGSWNLRITWNKIQAVIFLISSTKECRFCKDNNDDQWLSCNVNNIHVWISYTVIHRQLVISWSLHQVKTRALDQWSARYKTAAMQYYPCRIHRGGLKGL